MTTRDETALAIARAVNDWMLDAETTAPFLVSEEEELARTIANLLIVCPPAPAAITEAMVEAGAKAIGAYMYPHTTWEQLVATKGMWLDAARACLAAAQAQPGGEATNG